MYRFISKTVQDRVIVTMEDEYKLACDLSNGVISNDLQWIQGHDILNVKIMVD